MPKISSIRPLRVNSPGDLAVQCLVPAERQGDAVLDLLLRHPAAGGHDLRQAGIVEAMTFADEAHTRRDRRVIGQREINCRDIVRRTGRDVEFGSVKDHGSPGGGQRIADLAQPGDDEVGVAVSAILRASAVSSPHARARLDDRSVLWSLKS